MSGCHFTMDQVDSLEDWIAVKEQPFTDTDASKSKLIFHVAWNDIRNTIAITCREHSRVYSEQTPQAWTNDFTFIELSSIHEQLCLVHPSLGPYLPTLPWQPRGLWGYFSVPEEPSSDIAKQIQDYLEIAVDICGRQLLTSTLFEEHSYDEYFEKISELKRRVYDESVKNAEECLQNVLFLRDGSINMLDMCEVYKQEDEALFRWNISQAEMYNYLIQPFLDMREVSFTKVKDAKEGLQNPNLGQRPKQEFAAMFSEWHGHYVSALDSIQELYVEYYSKTVQTLGEARERMLEDKLRFGQKAFELVAQDRYQRILEDVSQERLQLLQNVKKQYENQRDKVKQEIASLEERPGGIKKELARLEHSIFDWQIRVLDKSMEILDEEERKLKIQRDTIKFEIQAAEEDVQFFDTVESMDELSDEEEEEPSKAMHPRLRAFQVKLSQLYRRRATLRNKKKSFVQKEKGKKQQKEATVRKFQQHHSIQMKRDEHKVQLTEKQEFINNERQKTLQRLREHKLKYPSPSTIKPPRYQPPSQRRKGSQGSTGSAGRTYTSMASPSSHCSDSPDGVPKAKRSGTADHSTMIMTTPVIPEHSPPAPPPPPPPPGAPPPPPPPPPPTAPPALHSVKSTVPSPVSFSVDMAGDRASRQKPGDTMIDEGTIQSAMGRLRSNRAKHSSPKPSLDPMMDMMSLIQQGVKLKPVNLDDDKHSLPVLQSPSELHTQQLREAFDRIQKKLGTPSDEEASDDNDNDDGDDEDDDFE